MAANMALTMDSLTKAMATLDAKTLRERALVFLVVLVLLAMVWDQMYLAETMAEKKTLSADLVSMKRDHGTLKQQLAILAIRAKQDPNKQRQQEIALLEDQLQKVDRELREKTAELIEPTEMVAVLETMLSNEPGLRLISSATTGSSSALDYLNPGDGQEENKKESVDEEEDAAPKIYKHGLEMNFEGDYHSVVRYIKKLEDLEWEFIWDVVEMKTTKYPKVNAKLHLYTLSLSEGWIGV